MARLSPYVFGMLRMLVASVGLLAVIAPASAIDLPIKPGTYVDARVACDLGGEAYSINYLGGHLHSGGTNTLEETLLSREGATYNIHTVLQVTQAGMGDKMTFDEKVTILSPASFKIATPSGGATYRWCNAGGAL